jgi:hypothetical protein
MDATTRFLSAATLSYAAVSPSTAAYLQLCRNELVDSAEKDYRVPEAPRSCLACGTLSVTGSTSQMTPHKNTQGSTRGKRHSAGRIIRGAKSKSDEKCVLVKMVRTECLLCGRYSQTQIAKKARNLDTLAPHIKSTNQQDQKRLGVETGERKRNRNRNKVGLKTLIASSKSVSVPSPGLNLMDFLKST